MRMKPLLITTLLTYIVLLQPIHSKEETLADKMIADPAVAAGVHKEINDMKTNVENLKEVLSKTTDEVKKADIQAAIDLGEKRNKELIQDGKISPETEAAGKEAFEKVKPYVESELNKGVEGAAESTAPNTGGASESGEEQMGAAPTPSEGASGGD